VNIDSNELVTAEMLKAMSKERRARYTPVPDDLLAEASAALRGAQTVHVPRSSKSPLAKWAAEKRRKHRQMARESRRANR